MLCRIKIMFPNIAKSCAHKLVLVCFRAISIIINILRIHARYTEYFCSLHHIYFHCIFVVCSTAAREGYEEDAVYKNFQEQTFEAEDQWLLNNQCKCP
jgi:hypothetical protein